MVLVAPQPKVERQCNTLNIIDIQRVLLLQPEANRSICTNPAGEQLRIGGDLEKHRIDSLHKHLFYNVLPHHALFFQRFLCEENFNRIVRRRNLSEKFFEKISCGAGVEIGGAEISTEQSPPDRCLDTKFQRVIYQINIKICSTKSPNRKHKILAMNGKTNFRVSFFSKRQSY